MALVLLELNEINFDIVKKYSESNLDLPGFRKLFSKGVSNTTAELKYHELEPWIQWPSVHTGLTFAEHGIFRLGDAVKSEAPQIFEALESCGLKVGAISPMNATNKLSDPCYFIPDPWTETDSDRHSFSKMLTAALRQSVNDNAKSRLTFKTLLFLVLCFLRFVPIKRYARLGTYALSALRKPWRKALFLDLFLFEVHLSLLRSKKPDFSTLFLNAGAHIQHHYFLNCVHVESEGRRAINPSWYIGSAEDPVAEMLEVYDEMIERSLNFSGELIIATGLSQVPYLRPEIYYRLDDHASFLRKLGIVFESVIPRMTRDFLICFRDIDAAIAAVDILSKAVSDKGVRFFESIELRDRELFVELTYSEEINEHTVLCCEDLRLAMKDEVNFVAIKNGGHSTNGYVYVSEGLRQIAPENNAHVAEIFSTITRYFGVSNVSNAS